MNRRRGELRVYLGAAPGVGKTFAMLGEARRRAERGTDVVVGLVETHGRARTGELLDGLEVIPRRVVRHRGVELAELDTDAVLARAPEVVLVDELAHTNAPGSVREKRWLDVEALLAAGIDVLSTLNVQHLESLNDVVERITGARQRETVPDEVVRRAEQVELVDITPEALRRRMAHGNVYPAHRIDAALSNYFRPGNLTALRELALLWVADQVDVALRRHRVEQGVTETWETRERVVAAITGGPESETLIRRARRIARRAGADLLVVHVPRGDGLPDVPPHALTAARELADAVGAGYHTVAGPDVKTALLDFARGVNATQLVLGTSRRSRFARLFDEGIGAVVIQDSGPIDVHMVTHEQAARPRRPRRAHGPLPLGRIMLGWLVAVLLPIVVTVLGSLTELLTPETDVIGYLLATVVVALIGGLGPALFAAVLGGVLFNYFFTPPLYSLTIAEPHGVITIIAMSTVAVLVALVVNRAARRAEQAARASAEAGLLAAHAHTVLTHPEPIDTLVGQIQEGFGLRSVSLLERDDDTWRVVSAAGEDPPDDPGAADTLIPASEDVRLALCGGTLTSGDRRIVETAAGQALLALRQQRLAAAAAEAKRRADATELRTALLSSVGHDLRTPLTSIKAAISGLRDPELRLSEQDTRELAAAIEESTDRLTALVGNLLDSSRLATGAVRPLIRSVGYYEIVARALRDLNDRRGLVTVEVDEHLPMVPADVGLLERVVANVIDNALRHGGPTATADDQPYVSIQASAHAGRVELRVVDQGPGLPKGMAETIFVPFQRLDDRTSGLGLGLSVAKGFLAAMSGTIHAEDTPGGGLTIVIDLPAATADDQHAGDRRAEGAGV